MSKCKYVKFDFNYARPKLKNSIPVIPSKFPLFLQKIYINDKILVLNYNLRVK